MAGSGSRFVASWLVAHVTLAGAAAALAHDRGRYSTPSARVSVTVEVDGEPAPLYRAPDDARRYYLEARQGLAYAITLLNRTGERLGVVLTVDGLNVISGAREAGLGRMYVLDPYQQTTVRGWRTSLQEVRTFTFVDEQVSYATRSGQANSKMGWIELAVHRERRPLSVRQTEEAAAGENRARAEDEQEAPEPLERPKAGRGERAPAAAPYAGASRSYPGTGWGERTDDQARLVSFEPEAWAAERTTLRYEYRPALVALGVLPERRHSRDRLWQREHAHAGFAQPPVW